LFFFYFIAQRKTCKQKVYEPTVAHSIFLRYNPFRNNRFCQTAGTGSALLPHRISGIANVSLPGKEGITMKQKMLLLLAAVMLLTGCSASESMPETAPTAAVVTQSAAAETQTTPATEETTLPTEPELPWPADVRWYGTYYFEKRTNPDPNIVEGVVRFNSLLRNEGREPLTIVSAHADFYLGTEIVAQEDFDSSRLPDFFFHPGVGNLKMEYGESKVFQLYSTEQERGSYDRAVITYTIHDPEGNASTQTFHFAVNEEDITPYSTSDRTDWSPASRTEERWDFHMFPCNDTDAVLEYVGMYVVIFQDGLPMDASFFEKSTINSKALRDIQTLQPGQMMHYQEGITHQFNRTNEREHTMVYRDEAGERYLQTFCFALDEEHAAPDPFPILPYIYEQSGITVLDTDEKREQELGISQYSRQEIRQMIDDGLTLEELADKFTNLYEVQLFLQEAGIKMSGGDIKQRMDGILWHFNDSPEVVFRQRYGDCGSGSSLINYLLRGDYDEQGYLQQAQGRGGHVSNYFRSGDRYYIYDWTRITVDSFDVMIADSLKEYSDAYIRGTHAIEGADGDHRILLLYAYPYEGNQRPQGDGPKGPFGLPTLSIVPTEIQDMVTVLYMDGEQYAPIFVEAPPVSQWPKDAQ